MQKENLETGYIKIYRSMINNELYPLKRNHKFTKLEAMLDLLLTAHGDIDSKTVNGVVINRGQLDITQRQLAKRWDWNLATVNYFLSELEVKRFLERKPERSFSVITIVNYELYNPLTKRKSERKSEHYIKKGNESNKENIKEKSKLHIEVEEICSKLNCTFSSLPETFENYSNQYSESDIKLKTETACRWMVSKGKGNNLTISRLVKFLEDCPKIKRTKSEEEILAEFNAK